MLVPLIYRVVTRSLSCLSLPIFACLVICPAHPQARSVYTFVAPPELDEVACMAEVINDKELPSEMPAQATE